MSDVHNRIETLVKGNKVVLFMKGTPTFPYRFNVLLSVLAIWMYIPRRLGPCSAFRVIQTTR